MIKRAKTSHEQLVLESIGYILANYSIAPRERDQWQSIRNWYDRLPEPMPEVSSLAELYTLWKASKNRPEAPTTESPDIVALRRKAARWDYLSSRVFATHQAVFSFPVLTSERDLMKGSVAGHLDRVVDDIIASQANNATKQEI